MFHLRYCLSLNIRGFNRQYRIKNISQNAYKKISKYILGNISNDLNDFRVLTTHEGLPNKIINELKQSEPYIEIKEVIERRKLVNLTLEEASKISASNTFLTVLEEKLITKNRITKIFFQTI